MNNKTLAIIVVALLVMLGAGAFVMFKSKNLNSTSQGENTSEMNTDNASPKTLKDLLTAGTSQKCTYSDTMENISVSGTSYISGGKVRADFSSVTEGKSITGHTIFDGSTSYVWMDDSNSGFKMEIDPNAIKTDTSGTSENQGVDLDKQLDYDCSGWSADPSMFAIPAGVTFTSFGAPAEGSQGGSMQGGTNLCAACDSLSGDQKTQCLAALKCN